MNTEEVIAKVVSKEHMVKWVKGWVVNSTSTRHIGPFKEEFTSYTPIKEGAKCVYVDNNMFMQQRRGIPETNFQ